MKTYLIAFAASAAIFTSAMAAETNTNMQPAPAATAAPAPATNAQEERAKVETKDMPVAAPSEPAASSTATASEKTSAQDNKVKPRAHADNGGDPAAAPKKMDEHHARYHNGEGSSWKMGRNTYGFAGTYGGCQYRGHAGPNGYQIDKSC